MLLNRILDALRGAPLEETPAESPEERLQVALCVLLLEVARADREFSEDERKHIRKILRERFALSETDISELLAQADARRDGSYDLFQFTRQLNESYGQSEKIAVMEEIWRVIYADGVLDAHEDYLVHRLGDLLNLTHRQLIDAKMRVRRPKKGD